MDILRKDAEKIIESAIQKVLPDEAVWRALDARKIFGRIRMVSIGKAAWQMANAASEKLGPQIESGVVVTKYGHSRGPITNCEIIEAGHPIPDENSIRGAEKAIQMVSDLTEQDTVLFLISGGGSAIFEKPLVSLQELQHITCQLMSCGADIAEINTIRKRLSAVKAGKFAELCAPASVFCIVLSDVLGDRLDMIASGPACPDPSTAEDADKLIKKYQLKISEETQRLLTIETPKYLDNVETVITGSASELCRAAKDACEALGYRTVILTDSLDCEAREAGAFLAAVARFHQKERPLALLVGGETVVHLTGNGLGGRNQELALAAAEGIAGLENTAVFSIGSDGTDGPTDAAGGYVDSGSMEKFCAAGINVFKALQNNDAYHALELVDGLIRTGPTGTNVNDVAAVLIR